MNVENNIGVAEQKEKTAKFKKFYSRLNGCRTFTPQKDTDIICPLACYATSNDFQTDNEHIFIIGEDELYLLHTIDDHEVYRDIGSIERYIIKKYNLWVYYEIKIVLATELLNIKDLTREKAISYIKKEYKHKYNKVTDFIGDVKQNIDKIMISSDKYKEVKRLIEELF